MGELTQSLYDQFEKAYDSNKTNELIANAISNVGVREASKSQLAINKHKFIFSDEIDHKNITNQKHTGRCWMFAALNMARPKIIADLKLEEFELSETYLYFYDNMEKTNTYLERIIATKDQDINSRDVERALAYKTSDGGYFEYFAALIKKYGIVPKSAMGETFSSSDSGAMFQRVQEIIKKYTMDIRRADDKDIQALKEECLSKVYNIFVKCIGKPVQKFDFEYVDKDKKYHIEKDLTPQSFYEKYLAGFYDNMVRLINDPRERHPYGRVYTCPDVKNVVEDKGLIGLNMPVEEMKEAMIKSIKDKRTAWYAADVDHYFERKSGIMDTAMFNFEDTLVPVGEFSKADRIDSRQSMANHAMNIVGVNIKDGKPTQWKVENSWGDKDGNKGVFSMADEWFDEYVYELIVDKKYVSEEYLKAFEQDSIELDKYDPYCLLMSNVQ